MSDIKIEEGDTVKIEYEGTFDDGKVFDTSKGKDPIEFEVGAHKVIPGFEKAVVGMAKDEEKTIKIEPAEGYGERNNNYVKDLPRDKVNINQEVKPGMMLVFSGKDGKSIASTVLKVTDDIVTVDLNHPLAGKSLNFKMKVVDVVKAKK